MKKTLLFIFILLIGIVFFVIFEKKELPLKEKQSLVSNNNVDTIQSNKNGIQTKIKTKQIYTTSVHTEDKVEDSESISIARDDEQKYYNEEISRIENKSYIDHEEEVYQDDNQIFLNVDGEHKKVSTGKDEYYMPKLSSNKTYLSYEDSDGIIIQNTIDATTIKLGDDASNVSWHPHKELIVFVRTKDDGASLTASEIYLYDIGNQKETALTHTKKRIEIDPIFSEDGSKIYAKDDSTEEIISINIPVN